jgi:hypothetical protein
VIRILALRQQLIVYKRKLKKPIPYGVLNAAAHNERLIGTLTARLSRPNVDL